MEILIASSNLHKFQEFKEMFKQFPQLRPVSLHQFPHYTTPEETGQTFKENAVMKAEHAARILNIWTLADDSGLVVPALKGEPGVNSRRYAGADATDGENQKKLLETMKHLDSHERGAYFECCLALASPQGLQKCVEASCEGFIIHELKGRNGFGYDPLFIKNDYDKTFAEIDVSVKNRISHRRKAFERMSPYLENLRE